MKVNFFKYHAGHYGTSLCSISKPVDPNVCSKGQRGRFLVYPQQSMIGSDIASLLELERQGTLSDDMPIEMATITIFKNKHYNYTTI